MRAGAGARATRAFRLLVVVTVMGLLLGGSRPASAGKFKPFALRTSEGKETQLSDLAGKATLVVFFFPSCKYCNIAYPVLQKIHDSYRDRGLRMVWINMLPEQDKVVPAWVDRHKITVPVLIGATQSKLEKNYGLRMAPTIFLVGDEDKVRYKHAGYEAGDEKEIREAIEKALEASS